MVKELTFTKKHSKDFYTNNNGNIRKAEALIFTKKLCKAFNRNPV